MDYKDGTRIPIDKKCFCPTNKTFWKLAVDVQNQFETRSMIKYKKKVTWKYMDTYYNKLKS